MSGSSLAAQLGLAAAAASPAAGISAWAAVNQASIPFIGVPLIVVSMAATGALISFGIGEPVRDRGRMFKMAGVNSVLASVLAGFLPAVLQWSWAQGEGARWLPPFALLVGFALRFLIPVAIDLAPAAARGVLKRFFGIEAAPPTRKES